MSYKVSDENLRIELLELIEETINQVPKKSEMKESVILRSFIVFALGCFTGIEMYVINLFLTSRIDISVMLLVFFVLVGFLIGAFVEKIDLLNNKSKYSHLDY